MLMKNGKQALPLSEPQKKGTSDEIPFSVEL